jgi:hypothetical protein
MSYTQKQIQDIINNEGGHDLSISTIRNDIEFVKNDWRNKTLANYDELMNRELSRIDSTERAAWGAWRASCNDSEKEVVERIAKEIEGEVEGDVDIEMVVDKIITTTSKSNGVGDPRLFDKIITLQKERRKLLGLYAPTKLGIDINKKSELVVKGYAVKDVSPDVWPDIVEGEVIEPEKLGDGS